MTCVNCSNKIEKKLNRTKGVIRAHVSYNDATADIVYDEERISPKEMVAAIESLGYEVILTKKNAGSDFMNTVCMLVLIVWLYVLLQRNGILNLLAPSRLADTGMGYGMLFVIGLITSVHCLAMCGGINLSQCIPQTARGEESDTGKASALSPALFYNMGRVLSYTAVGFVLGLTGFLISGGTQVGLSTFLQGILKMIAGLFMVIMGINMLELFPGLRPLTIRMPKFLAQKIGSRKAKTARPFMVGVLNGFMPCGPLQSMWIVALATANPFAGALSMFLFGLGTVPLMLGFGSIVSALGRKFTDKVMTVGAVLIVVLGLAMLSQGGSLSGLLSPDLLLILVIALGLTGAMLSIPIEKKIMRNAVRVASFMLVIGFCELWINCGTLPANTPVEEPVEDNNEETAYDVQVVNSTLQSGSYPNITVQSGVPVRWVIDVPEGSINGCNNRMFISDYDIDYTFHTGENVIEFTPDNTGTVHYSCWMGMVRGNIFVK